MKEEPTKYTAADLNDATFKLKLYLTKISDQNSTQVTLEKICHLTVESCLKLGDSEQFVKEAYEKLKSTVLQKKNYYVLYIIDTLLKNNKYFMAFARRDLETMFKIVWQKLNTEQKKQIKIQNLKCMVKIWGVLFSKKLNIQESIKKWLKEKYDTDLSISEKSKNLFEEAYEKQKNSNGAKLEALMSQLSKQQPKKRKPEISFDLKQKIFQD